MSSLVSALGLLFALLTGFACGSPTAPDMPPGATRITGSVHFYSVEGGFWAVRGDNGVTYDPSDALPPAFQIENLRVTVVAKVRNDLGGVHMVGPIIEILEISTLIVAPHPS